MAENRIPITGPDFEDCYGYAVLTDEARRRLCRNYGNVQLSPAVHLDEDGRPISLEMFVVVAVPDIETAAAS